MSIITISRGSYSYGKKVAEQLAEKLGYECISRDILIEASEQFNIPEIKLIRAIHDAPSLLDRFSYGKEKYIAFIRAALLKHLQKGNIIYHGLAGHFFLQNISHVLKVRIVADIDERVREEMKRDKITEQKARHLLKKDDEERRKWSLHLYGADPWDQNYYDMILHIKTLSADDAVDLLYHTVQRPCFQATDQSQAAIDNLSLAAQAQAAMAEVFPKVHVYARGRKLVINVEAPTTAIKEVTADIETMVKKALGNDLQIDVNVVPMLAID